MEPLASTTAYILGLGEHEMRKQLFLSVFRQKSGPASGSIPHLEGMPSIACGSDPSLLLETRVCNG